MQIEMKPHMGRFMAALAAVMQDFSLCVRIRSSNYTGQFNDLSQCTIGHHLATVLSLEIGKWNNASGSSLLPIKSLKITRLIVCARWIKKQRERERPRLSVIL